VAEDNWETTTGDVSRREGGRQREREREREHVLNTSIYVMKAVS